MSIKLMSLVWEDHTGELSGVEKATLLRMADFAADNGTQIFPSVKRLALDTGFSERAIQYAIGGLVDKKRLSKTVRTSKSVHITNLYRINVAILEQKANVNKIEKKPKSVHNPVNKRGVSGGGGAPDAPGVVQGVRGGGAPRACDPSLIRQLDPSIANKGTINCSKNEQERLYEISQAAIPDAEKIKIMKELKRLVGNMKK